MSAPVDVLSVLDVLIRRAEFTGTDCEQPLPDVRAAVAELIDVANRAAADLDCLRAALARVRGEA